MSHENSFVFYFFPNRLSAWFSFSKKGWLFYNHLIYPFDGQGFLSSVSNKRWGRAKIHVKSDIHVPSILFESGLRKNLRSKSGA